MLILGAALTARLEASAQQPFVVGERAEYDIKYGIIHAGIGALTVVGIDTVRQQDVYRFRLTYSAGVNLLLYRYSVRDSIESWTDTATLHSLRFTQNQIARGKPRVKHYEIFPERHAYSDGGKPEQESVGDPLDDVSFLYFVRSQRLEVGASLEFPRYFKPRSNPITLRVIGRDTIEAAGKKWSTLVVQPIIKTSNMFSDGDARVWISDDPAHVIVQINTTLSIGSITMKLRSYRPADEVQNASRAPSIP